MIPRSNSKPKVNPTSVIERIDNYNMIDNHLNNDTNVNHTITTYNVKENCNSVCVKAKTQSRNNSPNKIADATNNVSQPINNIKFNRSFSYDKRNLSNHTKIYERSNL